MWKSTWWSLVDFHFGILYIHTYIGYRVSDFPFSGYYTLYPTYTLNMVFNVQCGWERERESFRREVYYILCTYVCVWAYIVKCGKNENGLVNGTCQSWRWGMMMSRVLNCTGQKSQFDNETFGSTFLLFFPFP